MLQKEAPVLQLGSQNGIPINVKSGLYHNQEDFGLILEPIGAPAFRFRTSSSRWWMLYCNNWVRLGIPTIKAKSPFGGLLKIKAGQRFLTR